MRTLVKIIRTIGDTLTYPTWGYPTGWYLGPAYYRYRRPGLGYPPPSDPAGAASSGASVAEADQTAR